MGAFLKSKKPDVKVVALEPTEARVHTGAPMSKHGIVGWMPGFHSNFIEGAKWKDEGKELNDKPRGVVDEWGHVSTPEGTAMAKELAAKEGMMVGPSSGAAIKVALDIGCRPEAKDKTIVVVVPSHGAPLPPALSCVCFCSCVSACPLCVLRVFNIHISCIRLLTFHFFW